MKGIKAFALGCALAIASMTLLSIVPTVEAHNHQDDVLSSIKEFKKCVRKQMRYKDEEVRIVWDVQSASCYAYVSKGGVLIPEEGVDIMWHEIQRQRKWQGNGQVM